MRNRLIFLLLSSIALLPACSDGDKQFDAQGVFEADEVIVSSEVPGKILQLNLDEGSVLAKDSLVAVIDSVPWSFSARRSRLRSAPCTKRPWTYVPKSVCCNSRSTPNRSSWPTC